MDVRNMVAQIDAQIRQLQQARQALVKLNGAGPLRRSGAKRVMSAAARKKIAAAQRARWAKWKAAKKAA